MKLPKLEIKINKNASFANYLWRVSILRDKPYLKRKILEKIPKKILKKSNEIIPRPIKFTFRNHPSKDLKIRFQKQKNLIKEVEKIFKKDWKFHYLEIRKLKNFLVEIIKNYGKFLLKKIQVFTRCFWSYKKIYIFADILSEGGNAIENNVFIGYGKKIKESYISLLTHELIHINTLNKRKILKITRQPDEIATVVLTNKIIGQLNKKLKLNIPYQKIPSFNEKILRPPFKKLSKFSRISKSYLGLVKKINKYLERKKYLI